MKAQNPALKMIVGLGFLVLIFSVWKNSKPTATEKPADPSPTVLGNPAEPERKTSVSLSTTSTTLAVSTTTEASSLKTALRECGPGLGLSKEATSPDDLVQQMEQQVGVKEKKKDLENYHLQMADGSQRRVHLIYYDGNDSKKLEMRFFKLDAEGYPEPVRISNSLKWNPRPEAVRSFLEQGQLLHHESKNQWLLQNGKKILMEIHDGRIFDLQIRGSNESLVCRENACRCLR